ncbi:VOC family protein [Patescibacteria group bacterium]|nr:VOC family protein [Patescibacteria group bacterium]
MKLDAVGVSSGNLKRTIVFYQLLGFVFPALKGDERHIEAVVTDGSARLMIDKKELVKEIIGEEPKPSNHSPFAIQYDRPEEIDQTCLKVQAAGFTVVKPPWDAFWGQRYAIVQDPDGYKIDLYARREK